MNIDPYSIPPPRGWSPEVNPDQRVMPSSGSTPGSASLPASSWSESKAIGPEMAPVPIESYAALPPPVYSAFNSYPISPPIGSSLPSYTVPPPRGWTPSVALDPDLLHPPSGYHPSPSDR